MRTITRTLALFLLTVSVAFAQSNGPNGGNGTGGAVNSVTGAGTVSCSPTTGSVVCTGTGGSGTVTSLTIAPTTNQISVAGTCTVTTTGTCTLSLPSTLIAPGTFQSTGIITAGGSAGAAGAVGFPQGTANGHAGTTQITLEAPAAVTSYEIVLPGTSTTGFWLGTNVSNVNTITNVAEAGSGAGVTTGPTSGVTTLDVVEFTGTAGQIADSAVLVANLTTQTSNGAANQVCTYTGANKTCVPGTVTGAMMTNGTVTATQLAAQYSKGQCTELWGGSGTSFALQSGDDAIADNSCYNDSGVTRTITAVKCRSDNSSNTTTVNPTFGSAGTGTTILSGALTCGNSYAYSSTGTVSNASWTTGTGITPAMAGTLTGTSIAMLVEYTF